MFLLQLYRKFNWFFQTINTSNDEFFFCFVCVLLSLDISRCVKQLATVTENKYRFHHRMLLTLFIFFSTYANKLIIPQTLSYCHFDITWIMHKNIHKVEKIIDLYSFLCDESFIFFFKKIKFHFPLSHYLYINGTK